MFMFIYPSLPFIINTNKKVFLIQDIANAWKGLEMSEKGFEEWLLSEMMRYLCFKSFELFFLCMHVHIYLFL